MHEARRKGEGPGIRLRGAAPADRPQVFREIYDDLLRELVSERGRGDPIALQMGTNLKFASFVRRAVGSGKRVLEIGCGFGATAFQVGAGRNEVFGVDTAPIAVEVATELAAGRPNFRFAVMDAAHLEFPDGHFDAAYSIDMLEHLHPDDVLVHLREVHRVLKEDGFYFVKTPSILSGPHGGSDPDDPGCPHLQEYTYGTLLPILRQAGYEGFYAPSFSMRVSSRLPGRPRFPASINRLPEAIARLAPRRSATQTFLSRFLGVKQVMIVAEKRKGRRRPPAA
ncbi:MAG TPA: class I SAM-dependent methyltransferase [Candidatus Polarisedimenticolia bacterium]|nr:class I SAM-dependent methyltransferase [Candidatus Polarisedimenticolia bacterium]